MTCSECRENGHNKNTCLTKYRKIERIKDINHTCPICMIKGEKIFCKTNCGHYFHIGCIKMWLENNSTCPTCRGVIFTQGEDIVSKIIESLLENMDPTIVLEDNVVQIYFQNEFLM